MPNDKQIINAAIDACDTVDLPTFRQVAVESFVEGANWAIEQTAREQRVEANRLREIGELGWRSGDE